MRAVDPRLPGIGLALLSATAFAITPTGAKLAFEDGSNTLTVVTLRAAIGAALTAMLMAATGTRFRLGSRALRLSLLTGLASVVASYGFIGSVAFIPVSLAVVIFFTHPLFVAALWHWQGRERLTRRKLLLALAAFAGLALAVGGVPAVPHPAGLALAALAAVTLTAVIHYGARAREEATSTQVNLYLNLVSAAVLAAATTALGAWALPRGVTGWLGLGVAGLGVTVGLLASARCARRW